MSRSRVFLLCCSAIGTLLLGGRDGLAQYYQPYSPYPPPPRERQLDDRYEAAPDEEDYRPSSRPGARLRHSYESDEILCSLRRNASFPVTGRAPKAFRLMLIQLTRRPSTMMMKSMQISRQLKS